MLISNCLAKTVLWIAHTFFLERQTYSASWKFLALWWHSARHLPYTARCVQYDANLTASSIFLHTTKVFEDEKLLAFPWNSKQRPKILQWSLGLAFTYHKKSLLALRGLCLQFAKSWKLNEYLKNAPLKARSCIWSWQRLNKRQNLVWSPIN